MRFNAHCRALWSAACTFTLLIASATITLTHAQERLRWLPTADSPFEVNTQLRPWTIEDEGWDMIFENFSMAGINAVYLVANMHKEGKRPFGGAEFPHNPVQATSGTEDSKVYWDFDKRLYGTIKPVRSDDYPNVDYLAALVKECRARDMKVGAELSHVPYPSGLLKDHPEWQQVDINGKYIKKAKYPCVNDPEMREYILALYEDLARNYDIDWIQTAQYTFTKGSTNTPEYCWCEDCQAASVTLMADSTRWDGKTIRGLADCVDALRKDYNAEPYLSYFKEFRYRTTTKMFQDAAAVISKVNAELRKNVEFRINDVVGNGDNETERKQAGFRLEDIGKHVHGWQNQDHKEDDGDAGFDPKNPNDFFDRRIDWLTNSRSFVGPKKPLYASTAPRIDATPEIVVAGVKIAVQHPAKVNGMSIKHYDGASFGLLRAVKQGLIAGGIKGLTPTTGWELEDMSLNGYTALSKELREDFGVETDGIGSAEGTFNLRKGTYTVRLTYWDGSKGDAQVRMTVNGKQAWAFTMNQDNDCWLARSWTGIRLKPGDKIVVQGQANGDDKAILDFIEFIAER